MKNAFAAALLASTFVAAPACAANLLVNGGFEQPDVLSPGQGGIGYQTFSAVFTGWTVDAGNVDIVDHFGGGNAGEGDQWLDLWGDQSGAISQTFNTILGKTYQLSFLYGNNPYSTSTASASFSVSGLNGSVTSSSGLSFAGYTGTFVGTGGATTLSFTNTNGCCNGGIALDGVSVNAVPEPAAWALMIAGFGLVGGAMRRRTTVRTRVLI
jgi:Protein of unknown function (DUF642)/PEP-CTERM motif